METEIIARLVGRHDFETQTIEPIEVAVEWMEDGTPTKYEPVTRQLTCTRCKLSILDAYPQRHGFEQIAMVGYCDIILTGEDADLVDTLARYHAKPRRIAEESSVKATVIPE